MVIYPYFMDRRQILESIGRTDQGHFVTTNWSVVMSAAHADTAPAADALAELCSDYWYPLYAFARRSGWTTEDAKDLTQGFFARVLGSSWLRSVHPKSGRFRSWLLASFKHHIQDTLNRENAKKRGGGISTISMDAEHAEDRYVLEPLDQATPDQLYDRKWAFTVIASTRKRLESEYTRKGKSDVFHALEASLPGGIGLQSYADVAVMLGMSESAIKVSIHRLRTRFGKALREEVARTVLTENEIDHEIRQLMEALS